MRILHVINNLSSGGAEKLIEEALPLMNKIEGIEVEVLLLTDKNNVFDKKLIEENIHIHVLPKRKIRSPLNILDIRKQIIKGKYDIVHTHLFPTSYWTSIAFKLLFNKKPKLLITEHSTHNRRREKLYFKYMEKFIYSSFDRVISISKQTQENLTLWIDPKQKNSRKFIIIENGVNLKKYLESKPYHKSEINNDFNEDSTLLCMVGRFSRQKDQATLIKSLEDLSEEVHLLLIGEGELKEKHEILAKELGVENRVHFLGFRNDVNRILQTSDIVILSSKWEGFGLAAVEGMAAGKPVIASDVPGLREVVKDAGILFSKGNSKELAEIIDELIKDKKEYEYTSEACLRRANHFDIKSMVERYINTYKTLNNEV
ncbi:glycosyltransferase [Priestia megaterium]|uniref:glycosyltransferase n=1 Tax=Priestia megaterium TaxID=1404 RepID=UPI002D809408|nr:glycosyltransferase [Priestia megaterium]MEB4860649.1 glycosyltransferase [Priestia megaterium]